MLFFLYFSSRCVYIDIVVFMSACPACSFAVKTSTPARYIKVMKVCLSQCGVIRGIKNGFSIKINILPRQSEQLTSAQARIHHNHSGCLCSVRGIGYPGLLLFGQSSTSGFFCRLRYLYRRCAVVVKHSIFDC